MRRIGFAVLLDFGHDAAGQNSNSSLLHLATHMSTHIIVEAAQDIIAAIDDGYVGAKASKDAGEFEGDVSPALDQNAFRKLWKVKHLI